MASFVRDDNNKQKWMCRWEETDDTGVHSKKKRGFLTKKEAQQWYIRYCAEKEKPQEPQKKEYTFDDVYSSYLTYMSSRVKETTYKNVLTVFGQKILPYFSGKKMSEITPLMLLEWQSRESEGAYRSRVLERARLKAMFNYAERYYDIPSAMNKVEPLRNTEGKEEMHIWTAEQFGRFYQVIDNDLDRIAFMLLYTLGCRRGELQALMWKDVDLDKGEIHISRTYSEYCKVKITSPKTPGSNRYVVIPRSVADMLREYKSKTVYSGPDHFVVGGLEPMKIQAFIRKINKYADAAGLPRIRVHDLRHSCASYLLSQGLDVITVSKRLGHADVTTTLNTYAHLMPSSEERTNTLVDGMLKYI